MSRNKDIKKLHVITGDPYSVCRAKMKRNHWNLVYAIAEGTPFSAVIEAINAVNDALSNCIMSIADAAKVFGDTLYKTLQGEDA